MIPPPPPGTPGVLTTTSHRRQHYVPPLSPVTDARQSISSQSTGPPLPERPAREPVVVSLGAQRPRHRLRFDRDTGSIDEHLIGHVPRLGDTADARRRLRIAKRTAALAGGGRTSTTSRDSGYASASPWEEEAGPARPRTTPTPSHAEEAKRLAALPKRSAAPALTTLRGARKLAPIAVDRIAQPPPSRFAAAEVRLKRQRSQRPYQHGNNSPTRAADGAGAGGALPSPDGRAKDERQRGGGGRKAGKTGKAAPNLKNIRGVLKALKTKISAEAVAEERRKAQERQVREALGKLTVRAERPDEEADPGAKANAMDNAQPFVKMAKFEHVEGAEVCLSLYHHYRLPNGRLVHFHIEGTAHELVSKGFGLLACCCALL